MTAARRPRAGPRRHQREMLPDVVTLLEKVLAGSADLRGAACTENPRLFDPDVAHTDLGYPTPQARRAAIEATCVGCPVRRECWAWAHRQPGSRVVGPTAATSSVGMVFGKRHHPDIVGVSHEPPPPAVWAVRRGARKRSRGSKHRRR